VREDDVGLPVANQVRNFLARFEIGHQLAVVDIEHVGVDAERLVARLDFGLPPLRQRTARHGEVSDVAVGQRHEFHLRTLRGEQRARPRELQLRVIWMRAERDDVQRPRRALPLCMGDESRVDDPRTK
jgi:hypothetical protein